MKKKYNCYNFYVREKGYGKTNFELRKDIDLILEEFTALANDYSHTLELINYEFPTLATICSLEIEFHVKNINKITKLKKED